MARTIHRLSARSAAAISVPGRHSDGGGLYLAVSTRGSAKRWVFLFRYAGKRHEMGLGGFNAISLARARELAAQCRTMLADGRSPLIERREQQRAERHTENKGRTFGEIADELIASKSPGWRNEKHRAQWRMTLDVYAGPLRDKPVVDVSTEDVRAVLIPIWMEKPETASRTRGRIEAVIDAARALGVVEEGAINPARWRGHLDHLLPKRERLRNGHHAALPWRQIPEFMVELRERQALAARALEWCILTAARIGETLGTQWEEIDLGSAIWECPAERMKTGRPHRVPLSSDALALIRGIDPGTRRGLVFPGAKKGKPLSNMVMKSLYKRMGYPEITTHGFRSSFRDWAGEATAHPREVCEAALSHAVGDAVEQAYRRGDALEKRRSLMKDWALYCRGE